MNIDTFILLYIAAFITIVGLAALTAIRYGIAWAMHEVADLKKKGIGGIVGGGNGGGGGLGDIMGLVNGLVGGGKK